MGVGAGLYMYDVVVKSARSLSHLLMSSCIYTVNHKKRDILFLTITLANLNQFLYFFISF